MGKQLTADTFVPVSKQSLVDSLVHRIQDLIRSGAFSRGDRLPSIVEMGRRLGVGTTTVREALRKLETIGAVHIRHGSGVYVSRDGESLVVARHDYAGQVTKQLLLDLIRTRLVIEMQAVRSAARNHGQDDVREMRRLLDVAGQSLDDHELLHSVNLAFHRQIARASGNTVLPQLLEVLGELFAGEQRLILDIHGSRRRDHAEHLGILEALETRDEELAAERMRQHLEGVMAALEPWVP